MSSRPQDNIREMEDAKARLTSAKTSAESALKLYESAKAHLETVQAELKNAQSHLEEVEKRCKVIDVDVDVDVDTAAESEVNSENGNDGGVIGDGSGIDSGAPNNVVDDQEDDGSSSIEMVEPPSEVELNCDESCRESPSPRKRKRSKISSLRGSILAEVRSKRKKAEKRSCKSDSGKTLNRLTPAELPRKETSKSTIQGTVRVMVNIPPHKSIGDDITFTNPNVPGQKLKVRIPDKADMKKRRFVVSVPAGKSRSMKI